MTSTLLSLHGCTTSYGLPSHRLSFFPLYQLMLLFIFLSTRAKIFLINRDDNEIISPYSSLKAFLHDESHFVDIHMCNTW